MADPFSFAQLVAIGHAHFLNGPCQSLIVRSILIRHLIKDHAHFCFIYPYHSLTRSLILGLKLKREVVEKMNAYFSLKNTVKEKLDSFEKSLCEDCCLNREHRCVIELFHILHYFDKAFSVSVSVQKFRLKLLRDLLFECSRDTEIVDISINSYKSVRPWVEANKENFM